jgi:RNase P subunit RPR2
MIIAVKNRFRAVCQHCEGPLLPVYRERKVTMRGVLSLMMLLLGVTVMSMSLKWGALVAIVALIIGLSGNRKYTVLVCAGCGKTDREL